MASPFFKNKVRLCRDFLALLCVFIMPALTFAQNAEEEEPFTDVPINSSHYLAVKHLFKNRIITGYGDGTFRPKEKVKRVEALSMILNSAKNLPSEPLQDLEELNLPVDTVLDLAFPFETDISLKTPNMETPLVLERTDVLQLLLPKGGVIRTGRVFLKQDPNFTDIDKNEWYFSLLKRAVSLDIIKGYSDGTFRPYEPVKLIEGLAILLRTHRLSVPELSENENLPEDVPRTEWYAKDVAYGVSRFFLTPSVSNRVSPTRELTRGELATLIYRATQNQSQQMQFGKASWYKDGASKIKVPARKEYLDQFLTAAHRTYKFGTIVRVTNTKNGKFVDVAINDRGPFVPGRIVDLSKTAFSALEDPQHGVASVQMEVMLGPP